MIRSSVHCGGLVLLGITCLAMWSAPTFAEPAPCYADAPAVLPAPMSYGRAYRAPASTIRYESPPAAVTYRQSYRDSGVPTTRVVTTAPVVTYDEPVVYTRTYYDYEPRTYVRFSYGHGYYPYRYSNYYGRPYGYYGSYGYGSYYGYGAYYGRQSNYGHSRYYSHYPSRRSYRYGHHGSSYRYRGYGSSRYYSRGHSGHSRSRGHSYSRGRSSGRRHAGFSSRGGGSHRGGRHGGFSRGRRR